MGLNECLERIQRFTSMRGWALTRQMRELIEEFVFHAVELVVGVVGRGLWRRGLLLSPLLLGRPADPRPLHTDQSHRGSGKKQEERKNNSLQLDPVSPFT